MKVIRSKGVAPVLGTKLVLNVSSKNTSQGIEASIVIYQEIEEKGINEDGEEVVINYLYSPLHISRGTAMSFSYAELKAIEETMVIGADLGSFEKAREIEILGGLNYLESEDLLPTFSSKDLYEIIELPITF